jgi:hypothetical protein
MAVSPDAHGVCGRVKCQVVKYNLKINDMDIFKKEISIYNGVSDTAGTTATLAAFLNSRRHVEDIQRLRACNDAEEKKRIKLSLPQATISGIFSPTRKAENLQAHSGLVCIDFDAKDNTTFPQWNELKKVMARFREVSYCSKSVSGNGYFAIIPIKYPKYHGQHFEAIRRDFLKLGLKADIACKDVCRLRCMTYDDAPYINVNATTYTARYIEPMRPIRHFQPSTNDEARVEAAVRAIERQHLDITTDYALWVKAAMALAGLGERGREYFHAVSRQNDSYKFAECERKYNNILRTRQRVDIGSFFYLCKIYGLQISNY